MENYGTFKVNTNESSHKFSMSPLLRKLAFATLLGAAGYTCATMYQSTRDTQREVYAALVANAAKIVQFEKDGNYAEAERLENECWKDVRFLRTEGGASKHEIDTIVHKLNTNNTQGASK